jgi:large conductance mechanosensitive channel
VHGVVFTYGDFINALLTFLLTAAALYFLVVFPMNKLAERRKRGEEPPPAAPSEEVKLLTEIRDALLSGGNRTPAQRAEQAAEVARDSQRAADEPPVRPEPI